MSEDRSAIMTLIENRNAALRARDTAGVVAGLVEDAVVYDLQPPLRFVGAAARDTAALQTWLDTWDGAVDIDMPAPDVRVDGDLGVVHGLCRMRGTKHGAAPMTLWFRTTLVVTRRADGWRIVHEHASVPMMMDGSGAAATDLIPEDAR